MNLKKAMLLLVALLPVTVAASSAQVQWVGFGIGVGVPYYRPYPYLPPYYARPFYRNRYPVYAAPPVYSRVRRSTIIRSPRKWCSNPITATRP